MIGKRVYDSEPTLPADTVAAHGCTNLRYYGDGWRCIECFAPYEVEPAWCIQTGGPATECLVCRKQDERDKRKHAALNDGSLAGGEGFSQGSPAPGQGTHFDGNGCAR